MDSPEDTPPVVVGISGASGSVLARATIERLLAADRPVIATATAAARMVWRQESEESFGEALERWVGCGAFTYCPRRRPYRANRQRHLPHGGHGRHAVQHGLRRGDVERDDRQSPTSRRGRYPERAASPRHRPPRNALDRNSSGKHGALGEARRRRPPAAPTVLPGRWFNPTYGRFHSGEDDGRTRTDRPYAGGHDLPRARTLRLNLRLRPPTIPPTHKPSQRYTKRNPSHTSTEETTFALSSVSPRVWGHAGVSVTGDAGKRKYVRPEPVEGQFSATK